MRFLLKKGKHYIGKKKYSFRDPHKDRIIESEIDLQEKHGFIRFERLPDGDLVKDPETSEEIDKMIKRLEAKKAALAQGPIDEGEAELPTAGTKKGPRKKASVTTDTTEGSDENTDGGGEPEGGDELDETTDEPEVKLIARHVGNSKYNIYKVIGGVETDERVNTRKLTKKQAEDLVEAGYQE